MQTTITCPGTGAVLDFEIPGDEDTLPLYWSKPVRVHCPICSGMHVLHYKMAYFASVMSQFACIPADMKEARVH